MEHAGLVKAITPIGTPRNRVWGRTGSNIHQHTQMKKQRGKTLLGKDLIHMRSGS